MADYTEHYQLHQWVPEDDFLRTDFNEDFAKIDAALEGKPEIVTGSYIGHGGTREVSLGFEPAAVVVDLDSLYTGLTVTPNGHKYIKITANGFEALDDEDNPDAVSANTKGDAYYYIAVK